ncbi:MAG TPA: exonuclease SbcCD subunit D [Dehalococcoidia bacterium]|nr:exonuclease SbcCD subunit D [Dehalococcoidia bacterium]
MRILHFSDLHIGVENYGRTDPDTGLSTRLGDFLESWDKVVEFALTQNVDLVLLAGDAYKGRDPSQTHQREFAKRLARLSQAQIPTFLLVGNHDLPNATSRANAVEIFSTLSLPHTYVGSQLDNYLVTTPSGPIQVLAVPWPRRSVLVGREDSRGLSIEEIRGMIEARMTEAIALRAEQLDPAIPAIIAGHVTVSGATVGTERSMMLGQDHVLLVSALERPQADYVALGHIHKHQILRSGSPMVVYSGSLQRVDFSEEDDNKGFCVIDLDPAAPQGRRLTNFQFQSLGARPFVTIDASVALGDADPTQSVLRAIARKDIAGAVVRVRISVPQEMEGQLRESDIREALQDAHYIAAISRETQDGERRTRLAAESARDLQPMQALKLYLESRGVDSQRQELVIQKAEELVEEEAAEAD